MFHGKALPGTCFICPYQVLGLMDQNSMQIRKAVMKTPLYILILGQLKFRESAWRHFLKEGSGEEAFIYLSRQILFKSACKAKTINAFHSLPFGLLKLDSRQSAKYTDELHKRGVVYMPKYLLFCPFSAESYTALPKNTAQDLISLFCGSIILTSRLTQPLTGQW